MKDKLRELAERWKEEASNTFGFHAAKKCADELLAIVDAEGDGGAVPDEPIGWVFQHEETGRMCFCGNDGINTPDVFAKNNTRHSLVSPAYASRRARQVPDGWKFKVINGRWAVSNSCCRKSMFLDCPGCLHTWSCNGAAPRPRESEPEAGILAGTNRTTSGGIGQP